MLGIVNLKIASSTMSLWPINNPTSQNWNVNINSLDESWAYNELNGLQEEKAIKIIDVNPSTYIEMLEYVPRVPFVFYLNILAEYLLTEQAKDNFGAASGFFDLLLRKVRKTPSYFENIQEELSIVIDKVSLNQGFYDADIEIFGDFKIQADEIKQHLGP